MVNTYPKLIKDQLERTILLLTAPKRIISLVPSQTELLYDLGLKEEVVGITKFCIHPTHWFISKTRVGGTKQFDLKKINALKPDLIIGNKEENEERAIKELMTDYPVWMSNIETLNQALDMIHAVGELVEKQDKAKVISTTITHKFKTLATTFAFGDNLLKRVAYFIWRKPYMVAGHDTFINEMLSYCKFQNVFAGQASRYPEITVNQLIAADPEIVLLSSEPYPFKEKHVQEFAKLLPDAKIIPVDGELFSWYGSRLMHTPAYLEKLIVNLNST